MAPFSMTAPSSARPLDGGWTAGGGPGYRRSVPLEFRILGPVEALGDGSALSLGPRQRALLAALLVRANEVVSVSRLVDDLWGDDPPETAQNILQGYVSDLRKVLGRERIGTLGPGYSIAIEPESLDLGRFEALLARADREDAGGAAEALRQALALWRGPALVDVADAPFAAPVVVRLEELRLLAVERRIAADLELARHREVVGELEQLVAEHPLRESLRGQLMVALYRSGRQADALNAYQAARRTLVDELGIEPSPALQALERSILRQDPALDAAELQATERSILVAPENPTLVDALLAVAEPLARRPPKELILTQLVTAAAQLGPATAALQERCKALLAGGVMARSAAFVSRAAGPDLLRLALEQRVDLLLLDGTVEALAEGRSRTVLTSAPCDVAVLVARTHAPGPVLVPFVGAEHDWASAELGAWVARAQGVPLWLAGPGGEDRDASRLLANASLAVQRALGVAAQPLLLERGVEALVRAADDAGLVVVGLSHRWRKEGLGSVRAALASEARPPVLLVRRGLRPGGLAPRESLTRFTWSLGEVGR
jgi:DNA-binding SARP family transcriptional activator